jgi:two-component system, chemotaxis family, protein-glutamate methylesterase/glutaminase
MTARVRVLVVDDSAFARKVLREVLATSGRIDVVGIARDGLEALEQIASLSPDVVTLDLVMPNLDGLGVLRDLPPGARPKVVVVSVSHEESELVVEALALGAYDFVRKPTSLATDRLYELGGELVRKVLEAAAAGRRPERGPEPAPAPVPSSVGAVATSLVVIGASTGGPQALSQLVPALPADMPPVVIALHIPADYTAAMAARLARVSHLRVVEAHDGVELAPGLAVLAPGGSDLEIERKGARLVARVVHRDERPYHPSVDLLFESAAHACGGAVLAAVLTGMGEDGLAGARAIRAAGGRVLAESAASCVIDGMPGSVRKAGLADAEAPLERMAAELVRWLAR